MIPEAYITEWRASAPWDSPAQVEQDLVISRALTELFSDTQISNTMAFRGGTALYKLYLTPAARYSEDIDLVQIKAGPIGPTLDRIHSILDPWLGQPEYQATKMAANLFYHFESETNAGLVQKLKIEINTREHASLFGTTSAPFGIISRWFSGRCNITTYHLDELLGTKLRALYQRSKGRDLFDLDYAITEKSPDCRKIADSFVHYVSKQNRKITAKQFRLNIAGKLKDQSFGSDVSPMLKPGIKFSVKAAAELVDTRLLSLVDAAWKRQRTA